ncbi:hypothetical protein LJC60_08860 [Ruminococcaceae bacterium OttesenSCG-928-D13]|nr:hypothetical protein [Ruminococcaceae bacterium OttesenSCG-928-D13]
MNIRTKKWLLVAGCLAICAVLVVLIGSSFSTEPVQDDPIIAASDLGGDVTVSPDTTPSGSDVTEPAVDTPAVVIKPSTDIPVKTEGGTVSSGPDQTIQPDVTKPKVDEDALTDPSKTPDGQEVSEPPAPVDHDNVPPPANPPASSKPSGGETEGGKIYVPGFGWVDNQGGGGQGTDAEDMYENGNKIGIMD